MATTRPFQPLTTVFTPPASCISSIYYDHGRGSYSIAPVELSGCYPSTSSSLNLLTYSPGICPSGWTLAAEVISCYTITTPTFSIATEMGIACCPDALPFFQPDDTSRCKALIDQATWSTPTILSSVYPWPDRASLVTASVTSTAAALPSRYAAVPSLPMSNTNKTKSTHLLFDNGTQFVWSPMMLVRYQATDTAVAAYWNSAFAGAAGNATTLPPADQIPSTSANHMTSGEIIGVIFGSIATFGILVVGLTLFFVRRKIVRRFQRPGVSSTNEKLDLKAELDDTAKPVAILGSAEVLEKEAPVIQSVELLGDVPLFELYEGNDGDISCSRKSC